MCRDEGVVIALISQGGLAVAILGTTVLHIMLTLSKDLGVHLFVPLNGGGNVSARTKVLWVCHRRCGRGCRRVNVGGSRSGGDGSVGVIGVVALIPITMRLLVAEPVIFEVVAGSWSRAERTG